MPVAGDSCATCFFSFRPPADAPPAYAGTLCCNRNAPISPAIGATTVWLWPPVEEDFWCGDGSNALTGTSFSPNVNAGPQGAQGPPGPVGPAGPPGGNALTGDFCWRPTTEVIAGRVRANGLTIGNPASGATERADNDTANLFDYLWANFTDAQCPVSGGRGATSAADFAANKTITLPDMRFRGPFGLDDMGNAAAGRSTGATFSVGNATTAYSRGGEAAHTLAALEGPTLTTPSGNVEAFATVPQAVVFSAAYLGAATNAHNTMPPFALGTWYIFL